MEEKKKTKDSFIRELTKMTRDDITEYILKKGKDPKITKAFSYFNE
jgi:hypothetical protein